MCAAAEQDAFRSWLRAQGLRVVLSDEHLSEALAVTDPVVRRARLSLMTGVPRDYLDPSGYLHLQEVLQEIRRVRPGWLLPFADTTSVERWRGGSKKQWVMARQDPEKLAASHAAFYRPVAEPGIASVRASQKARRAAHLDRADSVLGFQVGEHFVVTPNWTLNDEEAAWRVDCLSAWHHALFDRPEVMRDYADYLLPYVRRLPDESDFIAFWLRDVERTALRRNVMTALVNRAQLNRKISHGNALDALHASYVFDADYFVTADRGFHEALEEVCASLGAARPVFVDRGASSAVSALERVLANSGP